jgi:hypothetical protein
MINRVGIYLLRSYLIFLYWFICNGSFGQVGIGTTNPHSSSILEVASTTKGMLIPRMTMVQRISIASPIEGLVIYQTDGTRGFYYYNGSAWEKLTNSIPVDDLTTNNYRSIQVFSTPGSYSWVVPTGVYKIIVELWGGGGGTGGNGGNYRLYTTGGWISAVGGIGAIGGKGGYNKVTLDVIPGLSYSLVVGASGSSGSNGSGGENESPATSGSIGGSGGNSSFGSTSAAGGNGGGSGSAAFKSGYNSVSNGANGSIPADATVLNYDYPYNSFQLIRSYIPSGYVPIYPTSKSNAGENGLVLIFMGE